MSNVKNHFRTIQFNVWHYLDCLLFQLVRYWRYRNTLHTHNTLLIRLLKAIRQPTTGFTPPGVKKPRVSVNLMLYLNPSRTDFDRYTVHLHINLFFTGASPESQLMKGFQQPNEWRFTSVQHIAI
ncbi:hypothetical protein CSKR_100984 [Clonorchis sinensis]|uniref:Uncharacterized protein n=1 Tax=Clonorchis sinensis TaxID=79923 RepID=A0A3R7CJ61_CLOSI|nr:hypothetical protein CSKR_100984 [Clonorchis sinensis]